MTRSQEVCEDVKGQVVQSVLNGEDLSFTTMKTSFMKETRNRRIVNGMYQVKGAKMATSACSVIQSGTMGSQKTKEGVLFVDKEGITLRCIAQGQEEEMKVLK